jgi:hypothetical protein
MDPEVKAMIDWCSGPRPLNLGQTHALHFFLRQGVAELFWQGFLFYQHADRKALLFEEFVGSGHILPDLPWCDLFNKLQIPPAWVRMSIIISSMQYKIQFFNADGSGYPSSSAEQFSGVFKVIGAGVPFGVDSAIELLSVENHLSMAVRRKTLIV